MRSLSMPERIFLLALCFAVSTAPAVGQEPVVIENEKLRVSFSSQDGTLLDVYHRERRESYLGTAQQTGWFRVQIPLPYWEGHTAGSGADATVVKTSPDAVEVRSRQLRTEEGAFQIGSTLACRLEDDNLVCQLRLQNSSEQTIDRIKFPIVNVPEASNSQEVVVMPRTIWRLRSSPGSGEISTDRGEGVGSPAAPRTGLFSDNEIRTDRNPFDYLDPNAMPAWSYSDPRISRKGIDYPRHLPTAWVSYVADGRGVGFDVRDRKFQFQRFMVERRLFRDRSSRQANRNEYELSWNWFPLVRPGQTWETAEVYIKFGDADWHGIAGQRREWMRNWVKRPPTPEKLKSSIGWISRRVSSFDEIPRIAKQGVDVGAPYFILYGWSYFGPEGTAYINYPRFELGGVEALRRNLAEARKIGAYTMPWFNGTLSTETNLGHLFMGKDWVALTRWGGEMVEARWSIGQSVHNSDAWIQFDPSTEVREYWLDLVRRFIEDYGFTGFHMDQAYKNYLSYRSDRPELAFTEGYGDFYARAQEIVKGADPNGIFTAEYTNEHVNQYADVIWIFEGGGLNLQEISRLRYSVPWLTRSVRAVPTSLGHANQAFLLNLPLDIFDDLTNHPDYAAHLRRLHALKKSVYRYFYDWEFSNQEGFSLRSAEDGVLARSYREAGEQLLAVVVVNTTESPQTATLEPASGALGSPVRHYHLDGRVATRESAAQFDLTLPAYDVQVIVFGE